MKGVARIGVSLLGLYLIADALSRQAGSSWFLARAGIRYLVMAFGPAVILFCAGVVCLAFRDRISSWIIAPQQVDLPSEINLDRIECIILSLIGIILFFRALGWSAFAIAQFIAPPNAQGTDAFKHSLRSYAYVQTIAGLIQLCLAFILIFYPHKVQALLRKRRGF